MRKIRITAGEVTATATLEETYTSDAIWEALPIEAQANTWGDEIYFSIPVQLDEENARETVSLGDLGYWPPGTAFCIFFGPTPASSGDEIRPASAVNVFGQVDGDPLVFKQVRSGDRVKIERA
ncbi:MAG: cyclophilin-like fold protein [Chloroflexota bacterium]|nr:cyclophilin-like fold protein [Chloroflexota bacterium]